MHASRVPFYTDMLRICKAGTYKTRSNKGHGTGNTAIVTLSPVGRKRIRSCSVRKRELMTTAHGRIISIKTVINHISTAALLQQHVKTYLYIIIK